MAQKQFKVDNGGIEFYIAVEEGVSIDPELEDKAVISVADSEDLPEGISPVIYNSGDGFKQLFNQYRQLNQSVPLKETQPIEPAEAEANPEAATTPEVNETEVPLNERNLTPPPSLSLSEAKLLEAYEKLSEEGMDRGQAVETISNAIPHFGSPEEVDSLILEAKAKDEQSKEYQKLFKEEEVQEPVMSEEPESRPPEPPKREETETLTGAAAVLNELGRSVGSVAGLAGKGVSKSFSGAKKGLSATGGLLNGMKKSLEKSHAERSGDGLDLKSKDVPDSFMLTGRNAKSPMEQSYLNGEAILKKASPNSHLGKVRNLEDNKRVKRYLDDPKDKEAQDGLKGLTSEGKHQFKEILEESVKEKAFGVDEIQQGVGGARSYERSFNRELENPNTEVIEQAFVDSAINLEERNGIAMSALNSKTGGLSSLNEVVENIPDELSEELDKESLKKRLEALQEVISSIMDSFSEMKDRMISGIKSKFGMGDDDDQGQGMSMKLS